MSCGAGNKFTKRHASPSSQDSLRHQSSEFPSKRAATTSLHTKAYDFRAAELSLLSKYAPTTDEYQLAEMPRPLSRFAELLLAKDRILDSCAGLV